MNAIARPRFKNETPLGFWQAVCALHHDWGDTSVRTLNLFPNEEPTIEVDHFRGAYDSHSGTTRFRVKSEAAGLLKQRGLVVGEPYWGGRSTWKYVVTDRLEEEYWETLAPKWRAR